METTWALFLHSQIEVIIPSRRKATSRWARTTDNEELPSFFEKAVAKFVGRETPKRGQPPRQPYSDAHQDAIVGFDVKLLDDASIQHC